MSQLTINEDNIELLCDCKLLHTITKDAKGEIKLNSKYIGVKNGTKEKDNNERTDSESESELEKRKGFFEQLLGS